MHAHDWVPQVVFGLNPMWVASALLVITYAAVMTERINRAVVTLLGAGLTIILGLLNQEAALRGVDFNTLGLLVGMMLIVAITQRTGLFEFLAVWAAKQMRGNPAGILFILQVITAVASACLDNVTTVLLVVPVTLVITEQLKVPPYPFLVTQIFASNIGGTATLIGDPPNILIGSAVGLTFMDFVVNLAPGIIMILLVSCLAFHLIWGRRMSADGEARAVVMKFQEREAITDPRLLKQSLTVLGGVILAFALARPLGLEAGTIALFGAAVLMLLDGLGLSAEAQSRKLAHTFAEVEWVTIFFFIGLFVVVYAVEQAGVLAVLAHLLVRATGGDVATTAIAILWAWAILSAVMDNIPFVATMIPVIKSMGPTLGGAESLLPLWWALSLDACLGGNGTLVGASANLTVAGLAERVGIEFTFLGYLKLAMPLMLGRVCRYICGHLLA